MHPVWSWLVKNKEWVFSGVGVTILVALSMIVRKLFSPKNELVPEVVNNVTQTPTITVSPSFHFSQVANPANPDKAKTIDSAVASATPLAGRANLKVEATKLGKIYLQGDIWTLNPVHEGKVVPYRALLMDIRIGLGLRKARQVKDVRSTLNLVSGIEWMVPFKDYASCLIHEGCSEVPPSELRATRRKLKDAEEREQHCWTAYHEANPKAQQATTAFQQAISQFDGVLDRFEFFFVLCVLADALNVERLTTLMPELWDAVLQAQKGKNALKMTLQDQEAWFARNEVVSFAKNRRYSKSLLNFARAMAGLPEWGWFHSRRTCEALIKEESEPRYPAKVFELLSSVIRKTKPLILERVEKRVRKELLNPEADPMLRGYIAPQWDYLEEAIRFCRGKGFKRSELPFKIMDRFIYHTERGKSTIDIELARRNELR